MLPRSPAYRLSFVFYDFGSVGMKDRCGPSDLHFVIIDQNETDRQTDRQTLLRAAFDVLANEILKVSLLIV